MQEKYDKKLREIAPNFYRHLLYFECDDGWVPLLYRMSLEIEPLLVKFNKKHKYRIPCIYCSSSIAKHSLFVCKEYKSGLYYAEQVKEKYGTLHVYTSLQQTTIKFSGKDSLLFNDDAKRLDTGLNSILTNYAGYSLRICEICGEQGSLRNANYYLKVLCQQCRKQGK